MEPAGRIEPPSPCPELDHIHYLKLLTEQIIQVTELIAMSRNENPCKEIEIAERLTGKKESGLFKEIPNTIKLRTIEVTRT